MRTNTVDQFITGLCAIPDEDFRVGTVYDYLKEHTGPSAPQMS
jgi:hypothetical protein